MKETESNQVLDSAHLDTLEELISGMEYGSITLIIQDGKIIQIDKTEKHRIKN